MKYLSFFLLIICSIFVISCDKDEVMDNESINSGLVGTWNLESSSGGFAGINCQYQTGEVVLVFDEEDNLIVSNNVVNTSATCGGQEIGISIETHKYGVLTSNDKKFLLVDDAEVGEIEIQTNMFTLDQNSYSQGSGADGFISMFVK